MKWWHCSLLVNKTFRLHQNVTIITLWGEVTDFTSVLKKEIFSKTENIVKKYNSSLSLKYLFLLLSNLYGAHVLWIDVFVVRLFDVSPGDQNEAPNTQDTRDGQQGSYRGEKRMSMCIICLFCHIVFLCFYLLTNKFVAGRRLLSIKVFVKDPGYSPDHSGINGQNVPHMFVQHSVFQEEPAVHQKHS